MKQLVNLRKTSLVDVLCICQQDNIKLRVQLFLFGTSRTSLFLYHMIIPPVPNRTNQIHGNEVT